MSGLLAKWYDDFIRKSEWICGKRGMADEAGNFPVPYGGVFSFRTFNETTYGTTDRIRRNLDIETINIKKSKFGQIWYMKIFRM